MLMCTLVGQRLSTHPPWNTTPCVGTMAVLWGVLSTRQPGLQLFVLSLGQFYGESCQLAMSGLQHSVLALGQSYGESCQLAMPGLQHYVLALGQFYDESCRHTSQDSNTV